MKKVILTILMFFFTFSIAFAGPFGLSKGMSVEEVSKLSEEGYEPTNPDNDDRYIFIPKKKHELFKVYIAFIDKTKGLYGIRAATEEIKTTDYGTEVQVSFYKIVERLSKIYGKPKITNKIDSNYYWKKDEYWLKSLREGARQLFAVWEKGEKGTNLPEELDNVSIHAKALYDDGLIVIEYSFSNFNEIYEKQDDVL